MKRQHPCCRTGGWGYYLPFGLVIKHIGDFSLQVRWRARSTLSTDREPWTTLVTSKGEIRDKEAGPHSFLLRFASAAECGTSQCRDLNYREHFHCLDCNCRVFVKKEEMIRHFKWHKKRDESLQHGFMRYSPCDDCSRRFPSCAHNRKQTHYHCLKRGCDKVCPADTSSGPDVTTLFTLSPVLHQHFGCADACELPPERHGDHPRGLPKVSSDRGLPDRFLSVPGPENDSFPLVCLFCSHFPSSFPEKENNNYY